MSEFQTVAKVGEIPEGQGRSFAVNGTMVGVFLSQGRYLAINDFCPHMGASLAEGHVEDDAVMCPWHAWRFSLKDGTWLKYSLSWKELFGDIGSALAKDSEAALRVEGFWRLLGVGNFFVFLGALIAELGFIGGIVGGAKQNKADQKAKQMAAAERKRK